MKTILILCFTCIFTLLQAQKAPLKVNVTDFQGKALSGEQIWFEGKTDKKVYKGVSDKAGLFKIEVPGGQIYTIKIKSVGEAKDYNTIEIPKLGPNQQYGELSLTVQIQQPKSFTLNNVHFDTGKSSLRSSSFKELNELAEFMKLKPEIKFRVEGHTDNVGADASNLTLSQNRADAVKKYLMSKGINSNRLTSKGLGESRPIADNTTAEGRQKNRRTEVHLIK